MTPTPPHYTAAQRLQETLRECVATKLTHTAALRLVRQAYGADNPVAFAPLVWHQFCSRSGNSSAKTVMGEYVVQDEDGDWKIYPPGADKYVAQTVNRELARAWCEEHYLTKMRSALV